MHDINIGSDFDLLCDEGVPVREMLQRFGEKEFLYVKYLSLFAKDATFAKLEQALEAGDVEAALVAAHSCKGLCANLGIYPLAELCGRARDLLRGEELEEARALLPALQSRYAAIVAAIERVVEARNI